MNAVGTYADRRRDRRPAVVRMVWCLILVFGLLGAVEVARPTRSVAANTTRFVKVEPFRAADSRIDHGVERIDSSTWRVQVAGVGGVPAEARAVALSVVATNGRAAGHVTIFPAGTQRPETSNVNYEASRTYSTGVIVEVGQGGAIDIHTFAPVDVVIDVTGAFVGATVASEGRFVADAPQRLLDTRHGQRLSAGRTTTVNLPREVPTDATAAMVTLTSTAPNVPGYFTAYAGEIRPDTSTLNVSRANSTRATTAIVPVRNREVRIYSSHGGHLIVDFVGYFTGPSASSSDEGLFVPLAPSRQLDTRGSTPIGAGQSRSFAHQGEGVVVGSLAMIQPSHPGYATAFANGSAVPDTSSINLDDVPVIANMAVSRASSAGVAIFSSTNAHYLFDQYGYFTSPPAPIDHTPAPAGPVVGPESLGCSVSVLLVPSCGAWLGSTATNLDEYERLAKNEADIVHLYKRDGNRFPSANDVKLADRPGRQPAMLLINWKPSTSHTWRQIADGAADANIESVAAGIKAYPHRIFLTVWHEPENEIGAAGSGMTVADYVAMYRHVVDQLRARGVTNVVYVWNMMGATKHREMYDGLYPGHSYVDWIAMDPYGFEPETDFGKLVNKSSAYFSWEGFYVWATNKAPGKPIMLAEWGWDQRLADSPGPAALDGAVPILRSQYPALKALVYWNGDDDRHVYARLNEDSALSRAYAAAYARFANDPYFNSTPTHLARNQ